MRRVARLVATVMCSTAVVASGVTGAAAQRPAPSPAPDSGPAIAHDTSPPLRDIPTRVEGGKAKREQHDRHDQRLPGPTIAAADPVVQSSAVATSAPSTSSSFDGVGQGFTGPAGTFTVSSAPPDTNAAVGATSVVEIVNQSFAVFSKTGTVLYGPTTTNTLWQGFGGHCQTDDDGDGVVRYDAAADRFVFTQFANAASSTGPYYECVAVSQSGDPTGAYNRYAFQYSLFPDYPKLGVWPDAYYITFNLFSGNLFVGAEACAYDRAAMLAGTAATQQCFTTSSAYGGLLPADLEGTTPPPAGAPNVLVALGATSTSLAYWKFHVDWVTPANSTFTGPGSLTVASYTRPCNGGGTCIPQGGTKNKLDSLGDRLMYRLAYRNFGDHESLVVSHSVSTGTTVGARWYELRMAGGNPTVYQQSTYSPSSTYRWMPSISIDASGNLGLGYSTSTSTTHPGIRITGRLASDPLGQMTQGETTILTGGGSQTQSLHRWGDYASMAVDPVDGCTFWFASEYIPSNGSFNWRTRLAAFTFPSCTPPPAAANDFSIAASPSSGSVNPGGTATSTISTKLTNGSAQTIALSASGLPAGTTASFAPSSISSGGSATMTITTSSSTPGGSYSITVTGTGTEVTHTAIYSLGVVGPNVIVNGGFEAGSLSGWTNVIGSNAVSTSSPRSGTYASREGLTTPTSGDSTINQSFTAPAGSSTVTVWYSVTCPDTITYDWATITLRDNTAGTTTTLLAKTCTNGQGWKQTAGAITAGHSYTVTLTSHDDNYPTDPTYTQFDDIVTS